MKKIGAILILSLLLFSFLSLTHAQVEPILPNERDGNSSTMPKKNVTEYMPASYNPIYFSIIILSMFRIIELENTVNIPNPATENIEFLSSLPINPGSCVITIFFSRISIRIIIIVRMLIEAKYNPTKKSKLINEKI